MSQFPRAVVAKCHKLVASNNRNVLPHCVAAKCLAQMPAGPAAPGGPRVGRGLCRFPPPVSQAGSHSLLLLSVSPLCEKCPPKHPGHMKERKAP